MLLGGDSAYGVKSIRSKKKYLKWGVTEKDSEDEPANPNIIYEELDDEAFDGGKEQTLVDGKKIYIDKFNLVPAR
ncbi:hypothetical protein ACET3Z_021261 [Daucus carota]